MRLSLKILVSRVGLCSLFAVLMAAGWPAGAMAQSAPARVYLEFETGSNGSAVIVRSDKPITYTVVEEAATRLVLEVRNARPRSNNDLNPLVTSFFLSAIAQAKLESHWSQGAPLVRLVIELGETSPHRISQQENELRVAVSPPPAAEQAAR